MMNAANLIEDEGVNMAPGAAPYLAGAGMIASVKSQAMMQRMIAGAIRQEALQKNQTGVGAQQGLKEFRKSLAGKGI